MTANPPTYTVGRTVVMIIEAVLLVLLTIATLLLVAFAFIVNPQWLGLLAVSTLIGMVALWAGYIRYIVCLRPWSHKLQYYVGLSCGTLAAFAMIGIRLSDAHYDHGGLALIALCCGALAIAMHIVRAANRQTPI